MSNFSDYITPPPKAPYQIGDVAVVSNFFPKGAQTKRSSINIGKIGVVAGYKNVPGAYSKYLLKFDDGEMDGYMPSYLKGPFLNKEIAQKYVDDPKKIIDPKDIKTKSGKPLSDEWQTIPKLEAILKELLPKLFGFTWFDTPQMLETRDNEDIAFKLAELKEFPHIRLLRTHNRTTRKLRGTDWFGTSTKGYRLNLPETSSLQAAINNEISIDHIPTSGVGLDHFVKKGGSGFFNFEKYFEDEYLSLYNKAFKTAMFKKEVQKRLPELEGLF